MASNEKVQATAHLSLFRGRNHWLWGCSHCSSVILTTPPGVRPEKCPEECFSCKAKIDRKEGKTDAKNGC